MSDTASIIIEFIKKNSPCTTQQILEEGALKVSLATIKRMLNELVIQNFVAILGKGKSTKYTISPAYQILMPFDMEIYYQSEQDERAIIEGFNFDLIEQTLAQISIFSPAELQKLATLQAQFTHKISQLDAAGYKKEMERLAIDLSWKSSQIEGNTYTLLETEILLKEKTTAANRTKEEAIMLLNHKEAIDFLIETPDYLQPLSISKIEDIHSILIGELGIKRNLRRQPVGISGSNYRPLDNEFQIQDALRAMTQLINQKPNIFEKTLLALLLISYIQPFADGNKRTARIVSNAILMQNNCCPLSFRTVNSLDYKKAMLLFYEQNNISNFKQIFINQFEFAVKTYF